jgi:hypothetical protein
MKSKTRLLIAMLCGVIFASSSAFAEETVTLDQIVKAVRQNETQLKDCQISYTTTCKPYNADSRQLTKAEVDKMARYPGHYLPEEGVLKIKGEQIKLVCYPYMATSKVKKGEHILAYDGDIVRGETKEDKTGVVAKGRTHMFRFSFNPLLVYSATGDMSLSEELQTMKAELVAGLIDVDKTPCQVVKLYKMADNNFIVRSFKVYLDPARNFSLLKVEKFWFDFQCLERTMTVTGFTAGDGVYTPVKASQVRYARSYKTKTSQPVTERQLTVQATNSKAINSDDEFVLTYAPETTVWDDIIKESFKVKSEELEQIVEPKL